MIATGVAFNRVAITHTPLGAHRVRHAEWRAYTRCARSPAESPHREERGPGGVPGPHAASCCRRLGRYGRAVDVFFRRIIGVRRRAAQPELFAAVDARAARRLVIVRLDLGMQTHVAVFVGRWSSVLRAERVVDDLVSGEQRVVALRPDAAAVPTNVACLLDRREQSSARSVARCALTAPLSGIKAPLTPQLGELESRKAYVRRRPECPPRPRRAGE